MNKWKTIQQSARGRAEQPENSAAKQSNLF